LNIYRIDFASRSRNFRKATRRTLTSTENFAAAVASRCELRVVAVAAVDLVGLRSELLVDERHAAHIAQEASFVPVLVFVAQILWEKEETPLESGEIIMSRVSRYLGVDSNQRAALLASVGKHALVALDAVGMLIAQNVTLTGQTLVAVPAAKVTRMPVLRHRLCVLATENQLRMREKEKKKFLIRTAVIFPIN
jgi:hypothetical protein